MQGNLSVGPGTLRTIIGALKRNMALREERNRGAMKCIGMCVSYSVSNIA